MPIELYPSIAKIKRNGVYENLPGFVPETGSVATQQMIATSESSATAQYVHNKGEYFRLNDTLYQAIVKINVGDAIVVGTNCKVAVLGNDVTHIANSIADYELGIATYAHATGEYFMVGETLYVAIADIDIGDSISASSNCRIAVVGDELSGLKARINEIANNEPIALFDETISGTGLISRIVNIPSGTYTFSCQLTSSDTDHTDSLVAFYNGSTVVLNLVVARNTQVNTTITLTDDVTLIYFYASRSFNESQGDTFSYSNTKIGQATELSKEIAKKLETVSTENIDAGAVTPEKTDFVETVHSANLFDVDTMVTDLAWAYTNSPTTGGTVAIISNQYTQAYSALKIPLPSDATKISIITHSGSSGTLYSYYFTDINSSCMTYEYNVSYSVSAGKTLNVPSGSAFLYITFKNLHNFATAQLMISATDEPIAYVDYASYLVIPNLRVEYSGEWEHDATLSLPDKYELVVGDTFELFYQGIVKAAHWNVFDVEVICSKGNAYERKFVYTPVAGDIGNITCVINLYDPYHQLMDTKTLTLSVKAKASSPESQKVVLYVGDSLTNGGIAPGEFKRRLVGSGGTPEGDELNNIVFIGTCTNGYVDYEGYGGSSWNSYNTENSSNGFMWITVASHDKTENDDQHSVYRASNDTEWKLETIESERIKIIRTSGSAALPSSGTLTWVSGGLNHSDIVYSTSTQAAGNPFWDEEENKVDFGAYATSLGVPSIDYVYVLLGWNGSGTSEENLKSCVRTFINNVHTSFQNCKIVLLGLQCPARDGLAINYGATGILAHFYSALNHVFNLNKWYAEIASEYQYVSFVNIAGQFDTQYNMPTTTVKANTRSSTNVTIQSNGVHPWTPGYYQIADACYRDFTHKLQE